MLHLKQRPLPRERGRRDDGAGLGGEEDRRHDNEKEGLRGGEAARSALPGSGFGAGGRGTPVAVW